MQLLTPEAILSYPSLVKPVNTEMDKNKPPKMRYKADLVFPKGTDLSALEAAATQAMEAAGIKVAKIPLLKPCSNKIDQKTGQIKPIYDKGDFYISSWAGAEYPPVLLGLDAQPGYPAANFRGGNLVQAVIEVYAYNQVNTGVNGGLKAIQYRGKGNPVNAEADLSLFSAAPAEEMEAPEAPQAPQADVPQGWG